MHTVDGPRPIESIRVGDSVLSQGPSTGTLSFQPVVAIHRNQPAATSRIKFSGESIIATGIHRFWKAGKGWTMARDLKPGDRLRIVGGIVQIESIETDKTQPVFNLNVAENRDFFVGKRGCWSTTTALCSRSSTPLIISLSSARRFLSFRPSHWVSAQ